MMAEVQRRRIVPFRSAIGGTIDRLGHRLAAMGERRGHDWLTYNPAVMWSYHHFARADCDAVADALIAEFPDASRWADVGAGTGTFVAAARRRGRDAIGYERSPFGRALGRRQGAAMHDFDLTSPSPIAVPSHGFDLAYCFEVAEHLSPDLGDRLVQVLVSIAPAIVFTAAQPGQGGVGHLNEQPKRHWIHRFERLGARHDRERSGRLSQRFRENRVEAEWLIDNLIALEAPSPAHSNDR
jgi:SAM-dependent methyltransferase